MKAKNKLAGKSDLYISTFIKLHCSHLPICALYEIDDDHTLAMYILHKHIKNSSSPLPWVLEDNSRRCLSLVSRNDDSHFSSDFWVKLQFCNIFSYLSNIWKRNNALVHFPVKLCLDYVNEILGCHTSKN